MKRVSVVATVYNESSSVIDFLQALMAQTRPADQIVICDGGSTDDTIELLRRFGQEHPEVEVVTKTGNIAVGRNAAIAAARHPVIAVTDAGTRADAQWLEYLIQPFERDHQTEAVSGFFKIQPQSEFEKISATQILSDHDAIDPATWLPSSRSVAFTKAAWQRVGGYPEFLPFAGEDTLFDVALKQAGYQFVFAPKAIVYWRPRPNFSALFRQFYQYSYGDGLVLASWRVYLKIISLYALGVMMLIAGWWWPGWWVLVGSGFGLYLYRRGRRVMRKFGGWQTVWISVRVTLIHDVADICGFGRGVIEFCLGRRTPYQLSKQLLSPSDS